MDRLLKPCPFCGGEAEGLWGDIGTEAYFYVKCGNVGCHVRPSACLASRKKTTEVWNRRTPETVGTLEVTRAADDFAWLQSNSGAQGLVAALDFPHGVYKIVGPIPKPEETP